MNECRVITQQVVLFTENEWHCTCFCALIESESEFFSLVSLIYWKIACRFCLLLLLFLFKTDDFGANLHADNLRSAHLVNWCFIIGCTQFWLFLLHKIIIFQFRLDSCTNYALVNDWPFYQYNKISCKKRKTCLISYLVQLKIDSIWFGSVQLISDELSK